MAGSNQVKSHALMCLDLTSQVYVYVRDWSDDGNKLKRS